MTATAQPCVHCGLTCRCPRPDRGEQRDPAANPPCRECGRPVEDERLIYAQPTCLTCLPRPEPLPIRPAPAPREPAVVEVVEEAIREGDAAQHPTLHDWVRAVAIRAVEAALKLAEQRVKEAAERERDVCVEEALSWPEGTCWPWASDDPRGRCCAQRIADAKAEGYREGSEEAERVFHKFIDERIAGELTTAHEAGKAEGARELQLRLDVAETRLNELESRVCGICGGPRCDCP